MPSERKLQMRAAWNRVPARRKSLLSARPIQIVVLSLCMLINVLDGYDLQAAAFTSTSIMAEWGVATGAMGLTIFSVGVLGVGLGSLVLTPIADRLGRRPTVLIGL